MRKCLIAFALVAIMGGSAMAFDLCNPCTPPAPVCPPPPVCLPFTKKVSNACNPCDTERVAVACPNIWGKIFGARHTPTVQ